MATMREVQSNWTEITNRLLQSKEELLQFLRFSSNLYGLPFSNAALVYLENPNARYVASAKEWNKKGYHIVRGEHGITVFDETNSDNALRFLFEIHQTDNHIPPEGWNISTQNETDLYQILGTAYLDSYASLNEMLDGMISHYVNHPIVQRELQSHIKAMKLTPEKQEQYVQMLLSSAEYTVRMRCMRDSDLQYALSEPDLRAFDILHENQHLIRFCRITQLIYGNTLKNMGKAYQIDQKRKESIYEQRTVDGIQNIVESGHGTGRTYGAVRTGRQRTGNEPDGSRNDTRKMGSNLVGMDAEQSSGGSGIYPSTSTLSGDTPHHTAGSRGEVSDNLPAVPTGTSGTESGNRTGTVPEMAHGDDADRRTNYTGTSRVPDSGRDGNHQPMPDHGRFQPTAGEAELLSTEQTPKAETETPSVSAFSLEVDRALTGEMSQYNALKVCETPEILQKAGCQALPMLYTQKHLRDALHPKSNRNTHWHGLSLEQVKQLPELLQEPAMLFDSISPSNRDNMLIALLAVDADQLPLIISMKANGTGTYDLEKIPANFVTSIYGRENFAQHLERVVQQDALLYWNKEKSQELFRVSGLQLPGCLNNLDSDVIIHQSRNVVNSKQSEEITPTSEAGQLSLFSEEEEAAQQIDMALEQKWIDHVLRSGSNEPNCLLHICAEFRKGKTIEQYAAFLQKEYQTDGKGIYFSENPQNNPIPLSAWWDTSGISITSGNTARNNAGSIHVTWEAAAQRIQTLLEQGTYVSQEIMDQALPNAQHEMANRLTELQRNVADENSFFLPVEMFQGTFPARIAMVEQALQSPDTAKAYQEGIAAFAKAYQQDKSLMHSCRKYIEPTQMAQDFRELQMIQTPAPYAVQPAYSFAPAQFITEDEKEILLKRGSNVENSRSRIQAYFKEEHSKEEQIEFLKNEYGWGGYGSWGFQEMHDTKGIQYTKDSPAGGFASVTMKWSEVQKRIAQLVARNDYLTENDAQPETEPTSSQTESGTVFLGMVGTTAYYTMQNHLNRTALHEIQERAEHFVIAAPAALLSAEELQQYSITFLKIDRDVMANQLQDSDTALEVMAACAEKAETNVPISAEKAMRMWEYSVPICINGEAVPEYNAVDTSQNEQTRHAFSDGRNAITVTALELEHYDAETEEMVSSTKELEIGDVIVYEGKQWRTVQTGFMMTFENLNPNDKEQQFSHIGGFDSFRSTHPYTLVSQPEVQREPELLPGYTKTALEQLVTEEVQQSITESELPIIIKGVAVYGSRSKGYERADSDLDVALEYTGDYKESALFDFLHKEFAGIGAVEIDINPIRSEETGTLAEYLPRADAFLENKHRIQTAFAEIKKSFSFTKKQALFVSRLEKVAISNQLTAHILASAFDTSPLTRRTYGNLRLLEKNIFFGRMQPFADALEQAFPSTENSQSQTVPLDVYPDSAEALHAAMMHHDTIHLPDAPEEADLIQNAHRTRFTRARMRYQDENGYQIIADSRKNGILQQDVILRTFHDNIQQAEAYAADAIGIVPLVVLAEKDTVSQENQTQLPEEKTLSQPAKPHQKARSTLAHRNYLQLEKLFPELLHKEYDYAHYESTGFEPLSLEWIASDIISMMHTYVQNGDLMRDPDMCLRIDKEAQTVTAVSYEMSALGTYEEYTDESAAQEKANRFLNSWMQNMVQQGYTLQKAQLTHIYQQNAETLTLEYDGTSLTSIDGAEAAVADYLEQTNTQISNPNRNEPEDTVVFMEKSAADLQVGDIILLSGTTMLNRNLRPTKVPPEYAVITEISENGMCMRTYTDASLKNMNGTGGYPGKNWTDSLDKAGFTYIGTQTKESAIPTVSSDGKNYQITSDSIGVGVPNERIQANLLAIETLKKVEAEHRLATPDEQEFLSEYVGWGGLSTVFQQDSPFYARLKEILSEAEYLDARSSTLTAFYTPPMVIRSIYQMLERIGMTSGEILEPSCGIGNFIGMCPESMQHCHFHGVELDSISGRIAKLLYPKAEISITGYEKTAFPNNMFTAAIGNVPFGDFSVSDAAYDKQHFLIHDYFFAKTLDQICPGGIVAFLTSKGTMDKESTAVRHYLAERAELIGAIRLPNNTFQSAAGTTVTSDIIFLRKRTEPMHEVPEWVNLKTDENGIRINAYFLSHPEMILGEMKLVSGRYGMESTCADNNREPLSQQLTRAVAQLPLVPVPQPMPVEIQQSLHPIVDDSIRSYSFALVDNRLYFKDADTLQPFTLEMTSLPKNASEQRKTAAEGRIRAMLPLRESVQHLIDLQIGGAADTAVHTAQLEMEHLYDAYVAKYGRITATDNRLVLESDRSYWLLSSLEITEKNEFVRKADIFTKRTIKQKAAIASADTAQDALTYSIHEKACVDMGYMQQLTGKSEAELYAELIGRVFRNPSYNPEDAASRCYLPADEYLSGDVRKKLHIAEKAAETDPTYGVHVKRLQEVQPQWLEPADIFIRLGATWIPIEYYKQFMMETFQISRWNPYVKLTYSAFSGEYNIAGKSTEKEKLEVNTIYGTSRVNALKIYENLLNSRSTQVYDTYEDADGKHRVLNVKETEQAQVKQDDIKERFAEWIWDDSDRRQHLTTLYNETINCIRPREYDGSALQFPGMNPKIHLLPHQVNAVARVIYGGNTLLAHTVGAGKTFEMVAAAQELKRLGLSQKSIIVVPNHITEQIAADYLRLYPSANILVATKHTFEQTRRKQFYIRAMMGNYDSIIMGHTQFEMIDVSPERERAMLLQQENEVLAGLQELKSADENGRSFSVKQLEKARKSIQKKLQTLKDKKRNDNTIYFEELGIDKLFLDEAHEFKNLEIFTKMQNVGTSKGSAKASDMYMKTQYLNEITHGKGCVFATGTPISNSIAEAYTFMKYLQYDTLKAHHMLHFDSWAGTFLEAVTAGELAPEGGRYRVKTRFSQFHNLPELMNLFREAADIQTADMLHLEVPKANYHNVVLQSSDIQKELMQSFLKRADAVRSGGVDTSQDNMLAITNDGRKMALDQRMLNHLLPESETSKAAACADNVFQIWEKSQENKGTQIIFSDLSTPNGKEQGDGFSNIYQDIKEKLMAHGIPEAEIAFIHDADTDKKKEALFDQVRSGEVRVLLGSTGKMGTGTNVQERLIALHHIDVPWRPSDIEQREGRIIRRGNQNEEVDIYRYITEDTFDAYSWQLIERKQKIIGQIMTSKVPTRNLEDVDDRALSYAEVKAVCTGDPRLKEQMELDIAVSKLKAARNNFQNQKYRLEDKLKVQFPREIQQTKERIENLTNDLQHLEAFTNPDADGFSPMCIGGKTYSEKKYAAEALQQAIQSKTKPDGTKTEIGSYRGFTMATHFEPLQKTLILTLSHACAYRMEIGDSPTGNLIRIDNLCDGIDKRIQDGMHRLENLQEQQHTAETEVQKPFSKEAEYREKTTRLAKLNAQLQFQEKDEVIGGEAGSKEPCAEKQLQEGIAQKEEACACI